MGEYYSKTHRWGCECYSTLCDLVDELFDERKYNLLARQSFFLMYNHKTVMVKRLELLERKGLLKNAESNIANYTELSKELYRIMLLFIKYMAKKQHNNAEKEKIQSQIMASAEKDKIFTTKLVDDIILEN